jgi:hypothetical protein
MVSPTTLRGVVGSCWSAPKTSPGCWPWPDTVGGGPHRPPGGLLTQMAGDPSNSAIPRDLHIQEKAVVRHISHIYDLLGLSASPDAQHRLQAVVQHL